ncbi:hypothetical protein [Nereida sp. MMG025]|uniref:hypothetical protein n=1 Tax=Nereida sp. MMG025 TaxID=2909981 RepID=UPI001F3083F7|nr:hypothetical protein [Nereida sp. MMG025]MCF6443628.1 hypothetical protein [Nereida sp. MMG025]
MTFVSVIPVGSSIAFNLKDYKMRASNSASGNGQINLDLHAVNEDGQASQINIRFIEAPLRGPNLHSKTSLEMFMHMAMLPGVLAQLATGKAIATFENKPTVPTAYIDSTHPTP